MRIKSIVVSLLLTVSLSTQTFAQEQVSPEMLDRAMCVLLQIKNKAEIRVKEKARNVKTKEKAPEEDDSLIDETLTELLDFYQIDSQEKAIAMLKTGTISLFITTAIFTVIKIEQTTTYFDKALKTALKGDKTVLATYLRKIFSKNSMRVVIWAGVVLSIYKIGWGTKKYSESELTEKSVSKMDPHDFREELSHNSERVKRIITYGKQNGLDPNVCR